MNFLKTGLLISTLTSLIILSGCSDLFQKDVDEKSLESNKFKANCELNIDEFALIMEEPIDEAIDCLGKNLKLFIKAVESKRPGYLYRKSLESYIKRNRKDIKPEVLRALKSVFDINYLIYGEDPDYISEKNVDALVEFAKIFNDKAATNFKPIFMEEDDVDYDNFRVQRDQRIKPAALVISGALKKIFNENHKDAIDRTLDINTLLDSFTTENNTESMSDIKKLLFLKKVVLGGSRTKITHKELSRLIDNFSSYVLLALDGVRYKSIRMDQKSMVHFLNSDVELLNSLIFSNTREKEHLFTLEEAIDAVDIFLGEDSDLDLYSYYDLLKEAKVMLMQGDAENVTGGDLRRLFNHGLEILKTGNLFHRFWNSERVILESRPGRPVDAYNFEELYKVFKSEKARVDDFVRIVKRYRFQRGENLAAYYTDDYYRNADGVYEVAIYEYALTLVMKHFGCPKRTVTSTGVKVVCDGTPVLNGVYMKKEQVVDLVQRFSKVLIDNDLVLPGREVKTAETITLLGSLFQYQSDENKVFDVNEATEFAISLFTSIDISEDVYDYFMELNRKGKCDLDQYKRISPACFENHFFEGVCMNYPDQFPKLYKSLGAEVYKDKKLVCHVPKDAPNLAYLERSVKAARTCNQYPDTGDEVYYSKGDLMSVFLAMMHIETTIIRWDVRTKNNVMDPAEVMDAYNIYSPALDGFLEDMPGLVKKLKKQIYQYLVKYEQVPNKDEFSSIWKFVKFLVSFNKDAPANRKTIASILVTIGEQGTPSTFNCNCLKDPDTDDVRRCQEQSEASGGNDGGVLSAPTSTPATLTQEDELIFRNIQNEHIWKTLEFLKKFWADLF